ncbi:TetR/AcrR family transcriptional regulator [Alloprevotella rava]|uniref:AcrR family transcriptional regulator n=1 Tax=Alloprevotella rava TaxID=671218 RepID=A0A7W5XX17_9BACT|nr:TetR/AcrR family transcriptional regulator [Alloprevotella rava]MBB3701690.1 AcrR family transcriptional regulator [Alloprevotella rava]
MRTTNDKALLRERVIDAGQELFHKNGIRAVTMDDVAHKLHISKRTLYQLFDTKESLLIACQQKAMAEHQQQIRNIMAETDNVIEIILCDLQLNMKEIQKFSKEFLNDIPLYDKLRENIRQHRKENKANALEFIERGINQGLFRPEINAEMVYEVGVVIIDLLVEKGYYNTVSPFEMLSSSTIAYLRGISTEKGIEQLNEFVNKYKSEE